MLRQVVVQHLDRLRVFIEVEAVDFVDLGGCHAVDCTEIDCLHDERPALLDRRQEVPPAVFGEGGRKSVPSPVGDAGDYEVRSRSGAGRDGKALVVGNDIRAS